MKVHLVADESVTAGGSIVITDHGQIDARVETILGRISDELLDGIR
jgi:flagellar assembly protein FliH